eukprot:m.258564 g.258564  ORF g.258564 m.258564 type:complete len:154 (-) comp21676_c0_seq1:144-605(-)
MLAAASAADRAFLAAWRGGSLPFSEWTHAGHVRAAYLAALEAGLAFEGTIAAMRRDIQHFNGLHREKLTVGYHETLTHFWVWHVVCAARRCPPGTFEAFWAREQPAVGSSGLWRDYYTRDVLFSPAAREAFVLPDLREMPAMPSLPDPSAMPS